MPPDFSKQLQKAEEALQKRNFDFAVDLYRQLLEIEPDQGEARAGLRRALKRRFEKDPGSKFLKLMGGAVPLGKARTLAKLGKHDAAARALEDYLAAQPLDPEANLLLGQELEAAGHERSALAVYEFLAELTPRSPEALKRAGGLLRKQGEHPRALEFYERALAADPRDQDALKARKDLAAEGALSRGSLDSVGHSRERIKGKEQMQALERSKRLHQSEEDLAAELQRLEALLGEAPQEPERLLAVAEVHEKLKDLEAALEFVERALSYRKDSYELLTRASELRSKVLKKQIARAGAAGQDEQASRLELELHQHELSDARARLALRPGDHALRLQLAKRLLRGGVGAGGALVPADQEALVLDEALVELQRISSDPRLRPEALFLLGQCFHRKGFLDLAKGELQKALQATGVSTGDRAKEILYTLGSISEAEGRPSEARAHYARIYEIDVGYRDVAGKMQALKHV